MRNNNLKSQLPDQVAAVKFPFNPETKSKLSNERIKEINHLALKAEVRNDVFNGISVDESKLVCDTCGQQELLEHLSWVGMHVKFYSHFNRAFMLLMKENPEDRVSILDNFQSMSNLFRTIEANKEYINNVWNEVNELLKDIEVLDKERMESGGFL